MVDDIAQGAQLKHDLTDNRDLDGFPVSYVDTIYFNR